MSNLYLMKKILLSTAFWAFSFGIFGQTEVAIWNFNSNPTDATTSTGTTLPAVGTGSLVTIGGVTNTFATGNPDDPETADNSGMQTTNYPAQGLGSKTAGIQWNVNTTGFNNLQLEFYQRLSNTAANTWVLQYTLDHTGASTEGTVVWTDATTYTFTPQPTGTGDLWYFRSFNLNSITGLNNNATAGFRFVSAFDPIAGQYLAARSTSTYGTAGTCRFDLIRITETSPTVSIAAASNFQVVNEDAGTIQVPITIANSNGSVSKIAFGFSTYSDATLDSDFTLSTDTIIVPANSNGIFNLPISIINDNSSERAERIVLKIIGGINVQAHATNNYQIIYIKDNDYVAPSPTNELNLSLLSSFSNGAAGTNSAEIVAYDSSNFRLFIANSIGGKLDIVDFSNPATPALISSIPMAPYGNINSVTAHNGVVALAIESSNPQANGSVVFLNQDGVLINQVTVGAMPDMITFDKNFTRILTANEGEPNATYTEDPEGSVSIIDLTPGYANLTNANVTTVGFTAYNGQATALRAQGIRVFSTSATVALDFEPEYITISSDNTKAYVVLQENNAMVIIDLATSTIDSIHALGYSDYASGNGLDASDQSGSVLITSAPVKGAYMPDAIAYSTINGQGFVFSANEGDSREFGSVVDAARISSLTLDQTAFPDQHILKNNKLFGRLNGLTYSGDTDNDGDLDEIHTLGGRSFSIWNATTGQLVFDSKDLIEQITSNHPTFGAFFNASNTAGTAALKNRSDDKGPEPEGVSTAFINGSHYLFVSLERIGGVMAFNVNTPTNPVFVGYYNNRTLTGNGPDLGAEGIIYIPANESPNGNSIVILANEVSSTLSIYQVNTCAELAGAVLTADQTTICAGDSSVISFEPATGATFDWILNNEVIANETNDSLVVTTAGNYRLYVNNSAFACTDTSNTVQITVNELPTITTVVSSDTLCAGESTTLTASGNATFTWNQGISNGIAFTPTQSETYTVIGTHANTCVDSMSVSIVVNARPTVTANATKDTLCAGETTVLSGSGATNYSWNNNVTNNVSFAPTSSATYEVIGTDATGCSDTAQISLVVNSLPTVDLGNDITVCDFQAPVTLDAGTFNGYHWSTGASAASIQVSVTGNFSVTVTDANGCKDSDAIQVTVNNCASIDELSLDAVIAPNPTAGNVTIAFNSELQDAQFSVVDLQGKIVFQVQNFQGNQLEMDLSDVNTGMYILTISQGNNTKQFRLAKQ